ncbi:MAG: ABC-F family ATP-binding cassette domain-containing protein [Deltaproteobacteria bacterium]|nr:ABC-F family ATP-binding cassette domain-containing protein [Deltaproteobacteria bacterium]
MLQVDHVTFGYGADVLFEDVSFTLAAGERMALVAPNGQGKSSLLKIIAGDLRPDEGRVLLPKSTRVGYLRQSHEPEVRGTVLEALMAPFSAAREARLALSAAELEAADGGARSLERLHHAQERYLQCGADAVEREVSILAARVGFEDRDLARPVGSLSGGERGRLQLATVLASRPELLLLDEPTNHLDIESTEWLEGFLKAYPGAAVVVSHDRAFLDAVCPRTGELGLLRFRLYTAPYTRYLTLREEELQRERRAVELQRQQLEKTEDFIRRNLAGQKTNQAKSCRRALDKVARLENPEDVWADARKLGLRFAPGRRSGDVVLEATGLGARRGGRGLFSGMDLRVKRLERLAIVGPNGSGKSTLLKRLAGVAPGAPEDSTDEGEVRLGTNLDMGYFDQHLESLNPQGSCIDAIREVRPDLVVDAARQYLARFRFYGDDPFRAVGSLSGGERTRVALARLLLVPRNLLLLDEPTNHLDIPASEILEEALRRFDGTLIVVSHDRYFLSRVATRVVHLDGVGGVSQFPGTYDDFRDAATRPKRDLRPLSHPPPPRGPEEPARGRESHEDRKRRAREEEKRQRRVAELEGLIGKGEARLKALRLELQQAPGDQWELLARLADEEQLLGKKVDGWTDEWMRLQEQGNA